MSKFEKYDVHEALGYTPIAAVSDADVWRYLLTPLVRRLLGDITHFGKAKLTETVEGAFPGDIATNMNEHLLFGGKPGFVRFPFLNTVHKTESGVLVIKRDRVKLKVICWFGDAFKGKGDVIYKVALRDRRFDGTPAANDCSLLEYPQDDPETNTPIPYGRGLENTAYAFMPGSFISELGGEDVEFEKFIGSPFSFMNDPDKFLTYFWRAWNSSRAPGQIGKTIPDVSRLLLPGFDKVARMAGYDFVEGAVSHYHVVKWELNYGYRCTYQRDADTLAGFAKGIDNVNAQRTPELKLTRPQESWLCVLQNLRPIEAIPQELYLGGLLWPQTNLDQRNLWINHPLNAAAAKAVPLPLPNSSLKV
jgi:hypothetical protein